MTPTNMLHPERRVALVRDLRILDTPPERSFDVVAQGLARLYHVPVALVTFLDQEHQFIKAAVGTDERQRPLTETFCQYTMTSDQVLVIPDLTEDARTREHPFVTGSPHLRFYAGAPIMVEGLQVGTACIFDLAPRTLTSVQVSSLAHLARLVAVTVHARRYAPTRAADYPHWSAERSGDR
ncbi:GAF domain-containing protein [Deinococcus hohokamensis]|uniref:GAF domain-containing protein n=1 Tax=Deinococcus hohokamensis TaxID=309883 RepID=A0ABV9I5N5_9DEIO